MKTTTAVLALFAFLLLFPPTAHAVTFDWATVGNPGNSGELSGLGAGGYGPDAIVGGVDHTYQISKHEVTNAQYIEFLNAVATVGDAFGLYSTSMDSTLGGIARSGAGTVGSPYTYTVKGSDNNWLNRPVNYVSWGDAARFTNWLHNGQPTGVQDLTTTEDGAYFLNGATTDAALLAVSRETDATYFIPSEDEWYKAAYYDPTTGTYFDYPTGSNSIPSNDLINPDPGNNANFYQSGFTIGSPYYTTSVGEFENSESPYGTFDQGGNVWEWNEAILYGSDRGLRGGSFENNYDDLHAASRYWRYPTSEYYAIGFRVASIPEPGTAVLSSSVERVMPLVFGCGTLILG